MAKTKEYKLQARAPESNDWFDCGDVRFPSQEEGDKAAATLKELTGSDDFRCVACDEAEFAGVAR